MICLRIGLYFIGLDFIGLYFAVAIFLFGRPADTAWNGRVIDGSTRQPIAGATITSDAVTTTTGRDGCFKIVATKSSVGVCASGYRQTQVGPGIFRGATPDITLMPFYPSDLCLSVYGIGSRTLRDSARAFAAHAGLNALVIDVKGDRGLIPYRSSIPLAARSDANSAVGIFTPWFRNCMGTDFT